MMIFFIIAVAIIVILLCRETILHKGDFFDKTIERAVKTKSGNEEMRPIKSSLVDTALILDGLLPGDALYDEDA